MAEFKPLSAESGRHDAVKKSNDLGVANNLSDANAQSTADVIAASSKPAIMSQ